MTQEKMEKTDNKEASTSSTSTTPQDQKQQEEKQPVKEPDSTPSTKKVEDDISPKTVMYIFWLMYKSHLITRDHLTTIFKHIKAGAPVDITQFLVNEESKK